ncbi:MAG: transposase [Desulfobacteria bacterium]
MRIETRRIMKYNPDIHQRRSIRLKGYDYSQAGIYYVTICTKDRECLFGNIVNFNMELSTLGKIVEQEWHEILKRFPDVELDAFVIMPNHIHGIIIVWATIVVAQNNRAGARPAPTIGKIIGTFKSLCIHDWLGYVKENGLGTVGKFWQRNYYEHIIRNETELDKIREYIITNPLNWESDENYTN